MRNPEKENRAGHDDPFNGSPSDIASVAQFWDLTLRRIPAIAEEQETRIPLNVDQCDAEQASDGARGDDAYGHLQGRAQKLEREELTPKETGQKLQQFCLSRRGFNLTTSIREDGDE